MLRLPLCERTTFVLVAPHYPENVGASARAMKTMGLMRLSVVSPGRLARPEHEMAYKMAVKAWDVLEAARVCSTLDEAIAGREVIFTTSSHTGQSGVLTPRQAAQVALEQMDLGREVAVLFGNEKTGLKNEELSRGTHAIRIPMAAPQPSVNLAQACQLIAYEWFSAALAAREKE
jgi:TrmH family RNA methyltransferase